MEPTTAEQIKSPPHAGSRKFLSRLATLLIAAFLFGFGIRQLSAALNRSSEPAGFVRGMVQGALMPCAFPNLLIGNDVVIYAPRNTGLTYKLGYTTGVNTCGAIFFGVLFWRVNRWRKRLRI